MVLRLVSATRNALAWGSLRKWVMLVLMAPNEGPLVSGLLSLVLGAAVCVVSKQTGASQILVMQRVELIVAPLVACSAVGAVVVWLVIAMKPRGHWLARLRSFYFALTFVAMVVLVVSAAKLLPGLGAPIAVTSVGLLVLLLSAISVSDITWSHD